MKRIFLCLLVFCILVSCGQKEEETVPEERPEETEVIEEEEKEMVLKIDETEVRVIWEDNEAVSALLDILKEGNVVAELSAYGGFEQVGPLGFPLPREDRQMTTKCGDIVLYAGNQISLFQGSNSWSYTLLGRMDIPEEEVKDLLNKDGVTIELSWE